jgi:glyoxylase-like metal-dependent hydrolase (beta-lactamase superfamily II)
MAAFRQAAGRWHDDGHGAPTGGDGDRAPVKDLSVFSVLAPNPGPFTLEGTNTWIVGTGPTLVIDPGPDDPRHLEAVRERAGEIGAILLTHHHPDHALGALSLGRETGAPTMAALPRSGERLLEDGIAVEASEVVLRVVAAPGHTRDHVVFFEQDAGALFTGDAVLGRGTSVIDPPEGDLAEYVRTLRRLVELHPEVIFPGHGPIVRPAIPKLIEYLEHRQQRERQILRVLRHGPRQPEEMVRSIYAEYPEALHAAAARSVLAHLIKLEREGVVARVSPWSDRFELTDRGSRSAGPT